MFYRRIAIIGCPGSGKTTLARKLHALTGLPVYHLDYYFRVRNEEDIDIADVRRRMKSIAAKKTWIIDGNYNRTMDIRLARADFVIYFAHPTRECLKRAKRRFEETKGRQRFDAPPGMIDTELDLSFMEYIRTFRRTYDKKYLTILKERKIPHIILHDDAEGDAFLAQVEKEGGR